MAIDPGLAADTSTYMEAIAGDGGLHDAGGVWWLSPDVQLIGSLSGMGQADPGVDNTIDVAMHAHAAAGGGTLPAGTESLTIDLFVADPSLAMAPNNAVSTHHIDSIGMPLLAPGASQTHQFHWIPPTGLPAGDPQSHGHRCLIARCYADPQIPSSTSFFAPDDPHVAQHNICIVPCGGPGAATRPAGCGVEVTTVNPDQQRPQRTRLRAVVDLEPSKYVKKVVLYRLARTKGYARLAAKPPRAFGFQFKDVKAKVADGTKGRKPSYDAEIVLEPGELIRFGFGADLRGGKLGEAHVFHLTQEGPDRRPQGGLTVILLAI
jgi:hypothetical protein